MHFWFSMTWRTCIEGFSRRDPIVVFKERPDSAVGKMQLTSYMNGHSRQEERPFPFWADKGLVHSHRMQQKHYRGPSNTSVLLIWRRMSLELEEEKFLYHFCKKRTFLLAFLVKEGIRSKHSAQEPLWQPQQQRRMLMCNPELNLLEVHGVSWRRDLLGAGLACIQRSHGAL